ncbi:hypothetical protein ES703_70084 [subsurface metagenome]
MRRFVLMYYELRDYARQMEAKSVGLRSLNFSLEKKVEERTQQLMIANKRLQEEKDNLQIT